jgi:hypothetical protein
MRIVLTASYARISSHHLFYHMKTKVRRLSVEFWGCELESEGRSHDQHSKAPCFLPASFPIGSMQLASICFHNDALPLGTAAIEIPEYCALLQGVPFPASITPWATLCKHQYQHVRTVPLAPESHAVKRSYSSTKSDLPLQLAVNHGDQYHQAGTSTQVLMKMKFLAQYPSMFVLPPCYKVIVRER